MTELTKGNIVFFLVTFMLLLLGFYVWDFFYIGAGIIIALWWIWYEIGEY